LLDYGPEMGGDRYRFYVLPISKNHLDL